MEATSPMRTDSPPAAPRKRGRLPWNRRLIWVLVCLVSVTVLYYQWENWRSARELGAAWEHLVARVGTDDPLKLAPPTPPDSQNYFAMPVFKQWAVDPASIGSPFGTQAYEIPSHVLMPKGFILPEYHGQWVGKRLDYDAWSRKRASAGQPMQVGENPAVVMDRELGDGNGLLPQLIAGLDRPFSQMKPGRREALESVGAQPWSAPFPWMRNVIEMMDDLSIHLRAAAGSGNKTKVWDVTRVMLRLCEGAETRGTVYDGVLGMAMSEITFFALQEALACPVWDERTLSRLQMEVQKIDDLAQMEHAMRGDALVMAMAGTYVRTLQAQGRTQELLNERYFNAPRRSSEARRRDQAEEASWTNAASPMHGFYRWCMNHCPAGIHDANAAYLMEQYLDLLGPVGEASEWLKTEDRGAQAACAIGKETRWPNPRRMWGVIPAIHLGGLAGDAALTLFHRHSVVIACALERYRLQHGVFPASLDAAKKELAGLLVHDPTQSGHPIGYRPEPQGYLLWSAGDNRTDDGGTAGKDWLWRMQRDGQN